MKTTIPVDSGDLKGAVRDLLKKALTSGAVDAVYVPLQVEAGAVLPALVTDPARIDEADPLAPVMPINGARALAAITGKKTPAKIAAVLRPCEVRALIELVKLQQANLEGVKLISFDCPGTLEVTDYHELVQAVQDPQASPAANWDSGPLETIGDKPLRLACRMCAHPLPGDVDLHLQFLGADLSSGIPAAVADGFAQELGLAGEGEGDESKRNAAADRLLSARLQVREKELQAMTARMKSDGGFSGVFATCIRCHNCMTACPICYCKTCLFKTASFDHEPEHYLAAARRKGATRLLSDALLFHLTRLNHMSTSCVACGECSSACPEDIPVGAVFSLVGKQVQEAFEYEPGRSLEEPLPLITFRENEWTEVGEGK
ncbi:MAG: 4Fe-4S dicluster domain-containing protein [Anaerolineales bacterium]